MENAKALLRVANHLDADTDKEPTESLLFHGLTIVVPTLLGLAAELALKALYMREEGTFLKSHDLLELFDRLPAGMRQPSSPDATPEAEERRPSPLCSWSLERSGLVCRRYEQSRCGVARATIRVTPCGFEMRRSLPSAATNTPVFPCLRQRTCQLVVTHRHSALLPRTSRRTG